MRFLALFKKAMIENFRDWKVILLILFFAPFFVFLMYFYFDNAPTVYKVALVDFDQGAVTAEGKSFHASRILMDEFAKATYADGTPILRVTREENLTAAMKRLEEKAVDVVVEIPTSFSQALLDFSSGVQAEPAVVKTHGDPSNAKYIMAAVWCDFVTSNYAAFLAGQMSPVKLESQRISSVESLTDFDLYVPGLLALAFMMLMFSAASTIIREKDKGTIIRLRLSGMKPFEWLSAVGLSQVILGLLALGLTYVTAAVLGYQSSGSFPAVLVVGILSCLSITAISLLVAALLRTIFDLMTIGCFPFFILMFFSGGMFPLPSITFFNLGSRPIHVTDILSTSHSISALQKILNSGARLNDLAYELAALILLSLFYFAIGLWIFSRRHLRAR
jgi:ABC-2 type transport system permease protein